jgi:hypothetical protein
MAARGSSGCPESRDKFPDQPSRKPPVATVGFGFYSVEKLLFLAATISPANAHPIEN